MAVTARQFKKIVVAKKIKGDLITRIKVDDPFTADNILQAPMPLARGAY